MTAGASTTQAMVTGLTNGTSYVFTVSAMNAIGTSAPSAPSNAVTPQPIAVTVNQGWNLIDIPVANGNITTASTLLTSMNSPGQLGAGAISLVGTYRQGRWNLFIPDYTADQALNASQGIFVLSQATGTWSPPGTAFTSGQSVNLSPGWNLVAAPYPSTGLSTSTIATEIPGCGLQEIALYTGGGYQVWLPTSIPMTVSAASGLWIDCASSTQWSPG
jgi:hypothetical protein